MVAWWLGQKYMSKQEYQKLLAEAESQGVSWAVITQKLVEEKGYKIEWRDDHVKKLAQEEVRSDKERKEKARENASVAAKMIEDEPWGLKGLLSKANRKDELNDNIIPRVNPRLDHETGEWVKITKVWANAVPSAYNVVADVGNMALNPIDTANWLMKIVSWVGAKIGEGIIGVFDENAEENLKIAMQSAKERGWALWWLANKLEWDEEVASAVWSVIGERYGDRDAVAKTINEDPVWFIGDIAWVVAWGSTIAWKTAKLASLWSDASKLWRTATTLEDIARIANKVDPYNIAVDWVAKTAKKWAEIGMKWAKWAYDLGKAAVTTPARALERLGDETIWISKNERKAIKENPYQAEYWEQVREKIQSDWLPQSQTELTRPYLEAVTENVLDQLDQMDQRTLSSWPLYDEIRKINVELPMDSVQSNVVDILNKKGIEVKTNDAGEYAWLDFTWSKYAKSTNTSAITQAFDRIMSKDVLNVDWALNLRKAIDELRNWEWRPIEASKLLEEIRWAVDANAKDKIPNLEELDNLFSKQMRELDEVKEWIAYKWGKRTGEVRDNIISIIKNIWWENRWVMRQRLDKYMPDLTLRVDAVNNLRKLSRAYDSVPKYASNVWRNVFGIAWATAWLTAWWVVGAVAWTLWWGMMWFLVDGAIWSKRQWMIDKFLGELSPEAQKVLKWIDDKIEAKKVLEVEEAEAIHNLKARIQEVIGETNDLDDLVDDVETIE